MPDSLIECLKTGIEPDIMDHRAMIRTTADVIRGFETHPSMVQMMYVASLITKKYPLVFSKSIQHGMFFVNNTYVIIWIAYKCIHFFSLDN